MRAYLSKYIINQWTNPKSSHKSAQIKKTSKANSPSHIPTHLYCQRKRAKSNNSSSILPEPMQS